MNKHREIIYKKRKAFLENEDLRFMIYESAENNGIAKEDLEKKRQEVGEEGFNNIARFVSLKVLDNLWQDHLTNMEHMRDAVGLRAYGGKDPLAEYKHEGRRLFEQLLTEMDFEIADTIIKAGVTIEPQTHQAPSFVQNLAQQNSQKTSGEKEVGRNDLCPCGSGKKYKKCHGK